MLVFGKEMDQDDAAAKRYDLQNQEFDRAGESIELHRPVHGFHQDNMDEIDAEGDFGEFRHRLSDAQETRFISADCFKGEAAPEKQEAGAVADGVAGIQRKCEKLTDTKQ